MLSAVAACCNKDVGLEFDGGLQVGDSVADIQVVRMPERNSATMQSGNSFIQRLENAIQGAVHPDSLSNDSTSNSYNTDGSGSYTSTAQVIPFPVVSPYRPLTATRVPIEGLTAFPRKGYYFNGESSADFNVNGNDEHERLPPGHESLGFADPIKSAPQGIGLEQDNYSPLGMKWEGVIGQVIQGVPAIIGAAGGNPYYDPSQSSNPQLFPATPVTAATTRQAAPEGYYYDERGTLRQVGSAVGGAVGNIGQSLSDFVTQNPLLVLGGGVALVLLFMKPPSRR